MCQSINIQPTVKILKIRTPEKFAVVILNFECGFTIEQWIQKMSKE